MSKVLNDNLSIKLLTPVIGRICTMVLNNINLFIKTINY